MFFGRIAVRRIEFAPTQAKPACAGFQTISLIAILDCVRDIGRGAQLYAPTDRVFYPIENRYHSLFLLWYYLPLL
ncbi:hypothetical protein [Chroococcidiopsis sp. CCNUC1]|uniref:hypothetical protein n=1 Tax=Chroococcidiopsis sp. CCNUC1 TaxID=2653189 RepID=UPI0020222379|nr:hypothetical protein [Chroococcidiopsis sp. CCNUC1]URD51067.1 hypothetical protein M5J74_03570 [Chroococcidiopsis sp. CCNUC1]